MQLLFYRSGFRKTVLQGLKQNLVLLVLNVFLDTLYLQADKSLPRCAN